MNKATILLSALLIFSCSDKHEDESDSPIASKRLIVDGEADVYTFSAKPYDGDGGHLDGISKLDFKGSVFEVVYGKRVPLADVIFTCLPNNSFADSFNQKQNIISNRDGHFSGTLAVGSAMTMEGRAYQTRRSQVRIEKNGFYPHLLWIDYEMPEVDIILKRAEQGAASDR